MIADDQSFRSRREDVKSGWSNGGAFACRTGRFPPPLAGDAVCRRCIRRWRWARRPHQHDSAAILARVPLAAPGAMARPAERPITAPVDRGAGDAEKKNSARRHHREDDDAVARHLRQQRGEIASAARRRPEARKFLPCATAALQPARQVASPRSARWRRAQQRHRIVGKPAERQRDGLGRIGRQFVHRLSSWAVSLRA